jgi:hypothetical protein
MTSELQKRRVPARRMISAVLRAAGLVSAASMLVLVVSVAPVRATFFPPELTPSHARPGMIVSVNAGSYCPPAKFDEAMRSAPKDPLNPGPANWVRLRIVAGSVRTANISTPSNPPLISVTAFRFVVPALPPGPYLVAMACSFPPSQACAYACGREFQVDALPATDVAPPSGPSLLTVLDALLVLSAATLTCGQLVRRRRTAPQS